MHASDCIAARAAQLVDAWLRGYYAQGRPALSLEELAEIAASAREAAENEAQRAAPAACCCQS
jgi:hypothetical protein